jgi:hypothetical protein
VTKNTAPRKLRAQKYNPIFRVEPTSPLDRAVHGQYFCGTSFPTPLDLRQL